MSEAILAFVRREFWRHVERKGADECWLWRAAVSKNGYAPFSIGRSGTPVHRVAYELLVGPIPPGAVLDHTCHSRGGCAKVGRECLHRRCVNPYHLEPVTQRVNVVERTGSPPALNVLKTHCPAGHVLFGANLVVMKGQRRCRECMRRHSRNWKARRRATPG